MSLPFKIVIKRDFIIISVLLTLIYLSLELYYEYIISEKYAYLGFVADFSTDKYIISKIFYIFLILLSVILYKKSMFLYSIYLLLVFFFYNPIAVLFAFSNGSYSPFFSTFFFVAFFVFSAFIKFSLPSIKMPSKSKGLIITIISLTFLIPIVLVFKLKINLNTLLLSDIYSTRESFSDTIGGGINYLYNFLTKTIIPIALIFFLIKKKNIYVILFFFILLYLFVISGNKIVYFTSIIVIYFYYAGKNFSEKIGLFFILTLVVFSIFPIIDSQLFKTPILTGTFVNRMFFIPAVLTNFYFELFDGSPLLFAETHFFNLFVKSPYDMPIAFYISKIYWNGSDAYNNNGIVSDGFMNLGYFGVLLFSIIFTLLFSFFNSLNLHKGYFGLFFCYIFILLSAPLMTCLITGGLILFSLIALVVLKEKTPQLNNQ